MKSLVLYGCILVSGLFASAAEPVNSQIDPAALQEWQDFRFGMFIHWGPVSLTGHEIGWSRGSETPVEKYDQLYKQFNPTEFDANQWARVAKDAGMKYMVITSKHHDGFCLWPSKYTDYHIGNTPFKRDVLAELAKACKEHGIQFGTYYSICDWYHPDYPLGSPAGKTKKPNPDMDRYNTYLKNQMKELIDSYGPLGVMWFDGEWEQPWTQQYGNELYAFLKNAQPSLLVNNRVSKGREGMEGVTKDAHLNAGDFDTPEQQVGGFNRSRPWETCMTICWQWSWKPDDGMKSLSECVRTLLHTVGGDGNLLFNVGPMPDGRIEPRQVDRLAEMGQWVQKHAEGIYGTRGGPYKPGAWGVSTCKENSVYLFVMDWPAAGPLMLPPLGAKVTNAAGLDGQAVTVRQGDQALEIDLPADRRDPIAACIKLTVDKTAFDIEPLSVPAKSKKTEK
jgi:alpha-L-fucosidase